MTRSRNLYVRLSSAKTASFPSSSIDSQCGGRRAVSAMTRGSSSLVAWTARDGRHHLPHVTTPIQSQSWVRPSMGCATVSLSSSSSSFSSSATAILGGTRNIPNDDNANNADDDDNGWLKLFLGGNTNNTIREYQNPWAVTTTSATTTTTPSSLSLPSSSLSLSSYFLGNLDDDPILDRQSRFLIELLQTLYQVGLTKTVDRVTTVRANAMIERLAKMSTNTTTTTTSNSNATTATAADGSSDDDSTVEWGDELPSSISSSSSGVRITVLHYWQRAERARAILECMELFNVYRDYPQPLPIRVPIPTHETYWNVLRMYSSKALQGLEDDQTFLASSFAHQMVPPMPTPPHSICRTIVERMEATQELALQPKAMHWNQVLAAYGNASSIAHPKRSIDAAQLLYELDARGLADESSFSHTLRACCPNGPQPVTSQVAELSLGVAQRVWRGLQQHQSSSPTAPKSGGGTATTPAIAMQSYHFVHMMKAGRNFEFLTQPSSPSRQTLSSEEVGNNNNKDYRPNRLRQKEWIQKIFKECTDHRKVNKFVLLELIHHGSQSSSASSSMDDEDWILSEVLHLPEDKVKSLRHRRPLQAKELLRCIPTKWTVEAD